MAIEVLSQTQKYMSTNELLQSRRAPKKEHDHGKRKSRPEGNHLEQKKRRLEVDQADKLAWKGLPLSKFKCYTLTIVPVEQILIEIQDKEVLKWSAKLKAIPHQRN